jgi:type IV pilus assembly protein PilM
MPAMALLLPISQAKKRAQVVAIDLGSSATKAVLLQRSGERVELLRYARQDAPACGETISSAALSSHLKQVMEALGAKTRQVILVAGVNDCLLRHAELPLAPIADMRAMLKFNSKNYLQQDFSDYVLDCCIMPPRPGSKPAEAFKPNGKCRVLVGGAKRQFLDDMQAAVKEAGLVADQIAPNLIAVANAFEMAQPEVFQKEVVALVDIGFKSSTISILLEGELLLSRVVAIGGDRLTSGLSVALNISYPEAEGIKIGMPEEVQSAMLPLLTPLGRELRASLDFFEHQQDKPVSQVFLSGGSARSSFIVEALQSELMAPCHPWNPLEFASQALPLEQKASFEQHAPELAVATGGAILAL